MPKRPMPMRPSHTFSRRRFLSSVAAAGAVWTSSHIDFVLVVETQRTFEVTAPAEDIRAGRHPELV